MTGEYTSTINLLNGEYKYLGEPNKKHVYKYLELKIRPMRCYVLSVHYYRIEPQNTLKGIGVKRLEACEVWVYQRMLRIIWVEKLTNVEVIRRMRIEKEVILTTKQRKL